MILMFLLLIFLQLSACQAVASQSVVTTSMPSTLLPFTDLIITVQAKDSGGVSLTSGGEDFYISLNNHCTWVSDTVCTPASPASTALDSEISTRMTDNSDGTYSYTIRVDKEGTVTYRIMLTQTGVVTADYYKLSGTFLGTTQVSNIDFTYGGITVGDSIIYNGEYDYIRGEFRGLIKPPRSETYSFDLIKLDRGWIEIDGASKIPGGSTYSESFTMAMDANNAYSFYVSWEEDLSTAEIKLHWNETGSMAAVQSQYFVLPDEVTNGNITIACQSGYAVQASDPSSCTDVCGDGILTSGETCDDRNIASGDGCSSNCQTIENNYICVFNSGLPGHECSSCGTSGYPNTAKDTCILCSSGYQHASSNLNTCTQICGDGIQVSGETCDDGNSLSDDGCSKECQVEEHYKCTGQPSVCKKDKIESEQGFKIAGEAVSISMGVGMVSQMALSFSLRQSLSSMWMLINISQILQYSAMLTLYFPKLLISSYRYLSVASFDFGIFPNLSLMIFDKSLIEGRDSFDYRFFNQNIESTNIFMNCADIVFSLLIFLFLNVINALLSIVFQAFKYRNSSEKRGYCRRTMSHFSSRMIQIKNDFFFNSILRVVFEVYLPLSFASIYNIYDARFDNHIDYLSHVVSITFIIIFVLVLIIIPVILLYFKVSQTQKESGKFSILFKDLKTDKKIVIFDHFFVLSRRLALSLLLIFGWNHGSVQISIMITIGFLIIFWKIIVRPYQSKLLNFQDILFESLLLSILVLYLNFCSKSSELSTSGFSHICGFICLVLIVSMTIINFVISITLLFKKLKEYFSKASTEVKPKELKNTKFVSTKPPENTSFKLETCNLDLNVSNNRIFKKQEGEFGRLAKNTDLLKDSRIREPSHRPLTSRSPSRSTSFCQKDILFRKSIY